MIAGTLWGGCSTTKSSTASEKPIGMLLLWLEVEENDSSKKKKLRSGSGREQLENFVIFYCPPDGAVQFIALDLVCVKRMGSPWTIFFFIVRLLVLFGMFSSVDLGCLRLCLDK
jgi:hypothetical protein